MPRRVNARVIASVSALLGVAACGSVRDGGGGSRIEIEWLEPDAPSADGASSPDRRPVVVASPELGDGSAASEAIAGARRLLGLEIDAARFVRHVLAGALVATTQPASTPAAGDLARGDDLVAVVERVEGDGLVLVGLREGTRVVRWTRSARGLRFERP